MASYSCKESRSGELDLKREKDLSAEREREWVSRSMATFTMLPMIYSGSGAQQRRERQGFMVERSWGERESGESANGQQEMVPERFSGFICRDRLGLGCSGVGRDWASRAALRGGVVH
jgi:hypothetical protein